MYVVERKEGEEVWGVWPISGKCWSLHDKKGAWIKSTQKPPPCEITTALCSYEKMYDRRN